MQKRLLIIHPIIAPYRIDFFNSLFDNFDCEVVLWMKNLVSQKFDYSQIQRHFHFTPKYMTKTYGKAKLPMGLLREIHHFHPDIILCNECNPITLLAVLYKFLFNHNCKIATIIDDSYDMATGGNNFSLIHNYSKKLVLPLMDQIVCVEPRVEKLFRKLYGVGVTMPIIRDDNRFRNNLKAALPLSEEYVKKYNLKGKKVLLFVGRFVELKNMQRVIPVFRQLNRPDTVFVLVGEGPMETELKRKAAGTENIIFTGRLEGQYLLAWYNIAQLFILASFKEAFGAVTNEALLAGCYSLISRIAGSQSLIQDGINGNLIDPYDMDETYNILDKAFDLVPSITLPLKLRKNRMVNSFEQNITNVIISLNELFT